MIPLIVVVMSLLGNRAGFVTAMVAVLVSLMFTVLELRQIISVPAEAYEMFGFGIHTFWLVFAVIAMAVPIAMLNESLQKSEQERLAAVDARYLFIR